MLDMDLAISIYLEALQAERDRVAAEQHEAEARQARVVTALGSALKALAAGDLSVSIEQPFPDEYSSLRDDFHTAVGALEAAMSGVVESAAALSSASAELASASDDLSLRTEQQAAHLERTVATADGIAKAVAQTGADAAQAADAAASTRREVEEGGRGGGSGPHRHGSHSRILGERRGLRQPDRRDRLPDQPSGPERRGRGGAGGRCGPWLRGGGSRKSGPWPNGPPRPPVKSVI